MAVPGLLSLKRPLPAVATLPKIRQSMTVAFVFTVEPPGPGMVMPDNEMAPPPLWSAEFVLTMLATKTQLEMRSGPLEIYTPPPEAASWVGAGVLPWRVVMMLPRELLLVKMVPSMVRLLAML